MIGKGRKKGIFNMPTYLVNLEYRKADRSGVQIFYSLQEMKGRLKLHRTWFWFDLCPGM